MKSILEFLGVAAILWLLWLGAMWLLGKGCEPALQDIERHGLKHKVEKLWYGADGTPAKSP